MKEFRSLDAMDLTENWFQSFYKETPLLTAGNKDSLNTMTIGWGLCGIMWSKPVALVAVRQERYTHEFMEKNDYFTISFFDSDYQAELLLCGTKSGRDIDKIKETGLHPIYHDDYTYFAEARLVLVCKKIYKTNFLEEGFVDTDIIEKRYPDYSFHSEYYGEIIQVLSK